MILIAVDNGNTYTKTPNTSFPSGVKMFESRPPLQSNDMIILNDKYYVLVYDRLTYVKDKTRDDNLFILTLFAMAKEIKKSNYNKKDDVILSVGLPPGHFSLLKDKFRDYFFNHGETINFKYNDEDFSLKIKDVFVYPQAFSAAATKADEIRKYSRAYIIDIGGYTVDTLLIVDGNPDLSYVESLEIGVIHLYNNIKRKVSVLHDIKIEESDIEELMFNKAKNNVLSDNAEIKKIIYEEAKIHAEEIINKLRERGIDLKSNYAIFIGGGSLLLEEFFKSSPNIGKMTVINDTKANAQGYLLLSERMAQKSV